MKDSKQNKKVYVGISGGVDSSVSAALLKEGGYEVTGVFIRVWQPPFLECSIKDDRRDAMRVCAQLGIPFLECDAEEAYKTKVIDYMMREYKIGRTPNPDVMCNKHVKFGIFYEWAMEHGADLVATGHYARTDNGKLLKGKDEAKDQSYFLWAIGADRLKKTLFPIGHLDKDEVRRAAKIYNLFTADKKDSQGLCFLGKLDVKDFLKKFIAPRKGEVLSVDGAVIGEHDGAFFFTLGERHGFKLRNASSHNEALYVIKKDMDKNTITVGPKTVNTGVERTVFTLEAVEVYNHASLADERTLKSAVYRYHGQALPVTSVVANGNTLSVELSCGKTDIAAGQSMVLYVGDEMIAAGIIAV